MSGLTSFPPGLSPARGGASVCHGLQTGQNARSRTYGATAQRTHRMGIEHTLMTRIEELIRSEGLPKGTHLPAQWLADRLQVSRTPVSAALRMLEAKRWVRREPNRGYFLAADANDLARHDPGTEQSVVTRAYFALAEDLLKQALPLRVTEAQLKQRYGLTTAQVRTLLGRIAQEGWVTKTLGYGWTFSTMLTTPESLLQSYRLRLALEPAALREPGYRLEPAAIARCRAAEEQLLAGGIETASADALHERGVRFHETLVEGSGNPFFIETIRRINRVRRLLSYRSMQDRARYRSHCEQHLEILHLLERGDTAAAAKALEAHLRHTLRNLERIQSLLQP